MSLTTLYDLNALLLVRINIFQVFQLNKVKKLPITIFKGFHIRIGQEVVSYPPSISLPLLYIKFHHEFANLFL